MADISVEQKRGADLSWIWAAAAIIAIVALMAWLLSTQDEAGTSAMVSAADTTEAAAAAETVQLAAVSQTPDQYLGRTISVEGVPVAAVLGSRAFWADNPGASPVLVVLGAEVADASWLSAGDTIAVTGTLEPLDETTVDQWIQGQTLDPAAREQAVFATHYINATQAAEGTTATAQ